MDIPSVDETKKRKSSSMAGQTVVRFYTQIDGEKTHGE